MLVIEKRDLRQFNDRLCKLRKALNSAIKDSTEAIEKANKETIKLDLHNETRELLIKHFSERPLEVLEEAETSCRYFGNVARDILNKVLKKSNSEYEINAVRILGITNNYVSSAIPSDISDGNVNYHLCFNVSGNEYNIAVTMLATSEKDGPRDLMVGKSLIAAENASAMLSSHIKRIEGINSCSLFKGIQVEYTINQEDAEKLIGLQNKYMRNKTK